MHFNNNFDFQIEKTYTDPQGRFIICDIKTNEKCFTLGNIYAPKSLRYSKSKTKQAKQRETFLEQTIARLEADIDNKNSDEMHSLHLEEQLNESRLELEKIIEIRTKGAILRSKSKWYNEGEKNTKYFLNLEKRHYKQGTISQIKINDSEFVTSDKKILTECVVCYKNLYSSKGNTYNQDGTTVFFEGGDERAIDEHELTSCEGVLTEKECLEALRDMESEKTPGTDGLPAEFYKVEETLNGRSVKLKL